MSIASAKHVVLYSDHDHCLSVCGNAVLTYSLQPPNPRYLAAWTNAVEQLVEQTSGCISVLVIIDGGSRVPDEVSKREIRKTMSRYAQSIGALAYVLEGEGFAAAAVRSALSLIGMAARYPFPQKVFKSVADAVPWMLAHVPVGAERGVTRHEMLSVVQSMRHELKLAVAG